MCSQLLWWNTVAEIGRLWVRMPVVVACIFSFSSLNQVTFVIAKGSLAASHFKFLKISSVKITFKKKKCDLGPEVERETSSEIGFLLANNQF